MSLRRRKEGQTSWSKTKERRRRRHAEMTFKAFMLKPLKRDLDTWKVRNGIIKIDSANNLYIIKSREQIKVADRCHLEAHNKHSSFIPLLCAS